MEELGWLKSKTDPRAGRRARKDYRLTPAGRKILALVREQVRELHDELLEEKEK
jgi:DNA-binding PadR family transcriptional regulator